MAQSMPHVAQNSFIQFPLKLAANIFQSDHVASLVTFREFESI